MGQPIEPELYSEAFRYKSQARSTKLQLFAAFAQDTQSFKTYLTIAGPEFLKAEVAKAGDQDPVEYLYESLSERDKAKLATDQTLVLKVLGIQGIYADQPQTAQEQVPAQNKKTLMMFLMSKDDSLLLQMGALILSVLKIADILEPGTKSMLPELFSEEQEGPEGYGINSKSDLLNACVDVLCMVPPFRTYTTHVYSEIIRLIKTEFALSQD